MHRNIETQLSIEIANTPGEIARISDLLSSHGIIVSVMSIADEADRGFFRFISNDADEAESVLRTNGLIARRERVIAVKLNGSKGKLAPITNALARANINIDYFYASVDHGDSSMRLIMKVENVPLATRVLDEIVEDRLTSPALSLV